MDKYSDYKKVSSLIHRMMTPYVLAQQYAIIETISEFQPMLSSEKNALESKLREHYFKRFNEINSDEMKVLYRYLRRYQKQIVF